MERELGTYQIELDRPDPQPARIRFPYKVCPLTHLCVLFNYILSLAFVLSVLYFLLSEILIF
jgi:hypothetical protein